MCVSGGGRREANSGRVCVVDILSLSLFYYVGIFVIIFIIIIIMLKRLLLFLVLLCSITTTIAITTAAAPSHTNTNLHSPPRLNKHRSSRTKEGEREGKKRHHQTSLVEAVTVSTQNDFGSVGI